MRMLHRISKCKIEDLMHTRSILGREESIANMRERERGKERGERERGEEKRIAFIIGE